MILLNSALREEHVISTCSGKQLNLLAPQSTQIDIEDIAHGLAYQCCFNGQTRHFYSVAQHSMLVAQLVPPQQRLAALLHDGAAAYLGEMIRPLRRLMLEFQLIEKKIMAAISEKFGVSGFDAPSLQRAHSIALATEQRDLCWHSTEANELTEQSAPIPRRIEAMPPEEAKYQFTELLDHLLQKAAACPPSRTVDRQVERPAPESASVTARKTPGKPRLVHALGKNPDRHMPSAMPR